MMKNAKGRELSELEQAAMLIVLEAPRRSRAPATYVRAELVRMLESALRKEGFNVDAGLRWMRDFRRRQKQVRDAVIAASKGSIV